LYVEELHDLYSPYIISVITLRVIEMVRAFGMHGGEEKIHTDFWWQNLKKRDHLEDTVIDLKII
jgi:hypothetical protein